MRRPRPIRVASVGLLVVAGMIALGTGAVLMLEWQPPPAIDTAVSGGLAAPSLEPPDRLRVISWNLGYAGLGKAADFFMDGGRQSRPESAQQVKANLEAMAEHLARQRADILLLQEVDRDATRTFHQDQVALLSDRWPAFFASRATNFKVAWVPVPLLRPIGQVDSGLLTLSRFAPISAIRHQLPGHYRWPVRAFHLKRCLHEVRLPARDGKDWVVLHLHLSAFDKDGALRRQQMTFLRQLMLDRHAEGHHVVVGGDWNQAFPGLAARSFPHRARTPDWFQLADPAWAPPGWSWAFDPRVPSLRANNKPYVPGENFVTAVDGFVLSPDLELVSVATTDLGFEHSDHNPVAIEVRLHPTAGG